MDKPLDRFDDAIQALRQSSRALDKALGDYGRCPPALRLRTGEAASDVLRFCAIFREIHIAASSEVEDDVAGTYEVMSLLASGHAPQPSDRTFDVATQRLIVAYKALYFFIRAYQDRLYSVISVLVRPDDQPGNSMERAFHASRGTNPVRAFLAEHAPEYILWFPIWRDQRNRVKESVSFSTGGPAPQIGLQTIGIRFNEFTRQGGVSVDLAHAVQLDDVTRALELSARVAQQASGELDRRAGGQRD